MKAAGIASIPSNVNSSSHFCFRRWLDSEKGFHHNLLAAALDSHRGLAVEHHKLAVRNRMLAVEDRTLAVENHRLAGEDHRLAVEDRRMVVEDRRLAVEHHKVEGTHIAELHQVGANCTAARTCLWLMKNSRVRNFVICYVAVRMSGGITPSPPEYFRNFNI